MFNITRFGGDTAAEASSAEHDGASNQMSGQNKMMERLRANALRNKRKKASDNSTAPPSAQVEATSKPVPKREDPTLLFSESEQLKTKNNGKEKLKSEKGSKKYPKARHNSQLVTDASTKKQAIAPFATFGSKSLSTTSNPNTLRADKQTHNDSSVQREPNDAAPTDQSKRASDDSVIDDLHQNKEHAAKRRKVKQPTASAGSLIAALGSTLLQGTRQDVATQEKVKFNEQTMQIGVKADVSHDLSTPGSLEIQALEWGISPALIENLKSQGIDRFFPIQREVIPTILRAEQLKDPTVGDICLSAPTGSGKTLAYVLPVIQTLADRVIPRLRALVVLPTRELVEQVTNVFRECAEGTDLQILQATSDVPFVEQQKRLGLSGCGVVKSRPDGSLEVVNGVDILICTPGRLVDHLDQTPGFVLSHLRFLVVDEADRLLYQSYQDWVHRVHTAVFTAPHSSRQYLTGAVECGDDSISQVGDTQELNHMEELTLQAMDRVCLPNLVQTQSEETSTQASNDAKTTSLPLNVMEAGDLVALDARLCSEFSAHIHQVGSTAEFRQAQQGSLVNFESNVATGGGESHVTQRLFPNTVRVAPQVALEGIRVADASMANGLGGYPPIGVKPYRAHKETGSSIREDIVNMRPSSVYTPFRRILCSATLTRNPKKLAMLQLRQPIQFSTTQDVAALHNKHDVSQSATIEADKYVTPSSLQERYIVCRPDEKPLALIQVLKQLTELRTSKSSTPTISGQAIVFVGSVDTAHRLTRLLQLFGGFKGGIAEFSASMRPNHRREIIDQLKNGEIAAIISSDAAARGLDLPQLTAVIQYDTASRIQTYIHRVGRTARAGRAGVSYTLLKSNQVRHFRRMLRDNRADRGRNVQKEIVNDDILKPYRARYSSVLTDLKNLLAAEHSGDMNTNEPVEALGVDVPAMNETKTNGRTSVEPKTLRKEASIVKKQVDSSSITSNSSSTDSSTDSNDSSATSDSSSSTSDDSDSE